MVLVDLFLTFTYFLTVIDIHFGKEQSFCYVLNNLGPLEVKVSGIRCWSQF